MLGGGGLTFTACEHGNHRRQSQGRDDLVGFQLLGGGAGIFCCAQSHGADASLGFAVAAAADRLGDKAGDCGAVADVATKRGDLVSHAGEELADALFGIQIVACVSARSAAPELEQSQ